MQVTFEACSEMHVGHQECLLLLFNFNKSCCSPQVVAELPSMKFHENSFCSSQVATWSQTDKTSLLGTFMQFFILNAPEIELNSYF